MTDSPITPMDPASFEGDVTGVTREGYFQRVFVAGDMLVNVILGGNPDETISSRMARWAIEDNGLKQKIGGLVCTFLNRFDKDHGVQAMASDLGRAEAIEKIIQADPVVEASEGK